MGREDGASAGIEEQPEVFADKSVGCDILARISSCSPLRGLGDGPHTVVESVGYKEGLPIQPHAGWSKQETQGRPSDRIRSRTRATPTSLRPRWLACS